MKTLLRYLAIGACVFGLSSCEEFFTHPIEYFVETPDPSLVVNAELNHSTRANVEVSNSTAIFGVPSIPIKWQRNASVLMFEDGVFWDTLRFLPNIGQSWVDSSFISSKLIKANKNYAIKVDAAGFTSVTANTNIPASVSPVSFKWVNYPTQAAIRLQPIAADQVYVLRFYSTTDNVYFRSKNPILEFDEDDFIDFGFDEGAFIEGWVRPQRMNGQEQTIQIEFVYNQNDQIFTALTVANNNLFRYWSDLKNFDPNNPFNEPVQVNSNVNGGYGIFSAYSTSQTKISF